MYIYAVEFYNKDHLFHQKFYIRSDTELETKDELIDYLVRAFPFSESSMRILVDCIPPGVCEHITEFLEIDERRFEDDTGMGVQEFAKLLRPGMGYPA